MRVRVDQAEQLLEQRQAKLKALERGEKETHDTLSTMQGLSKNAQAQLEQQASELARVQKRAAELEYQLETAWQDLAEQVRAPTKKI